MQNSPDKWYVYMLCCSDNSYYTGITKDLSRRLHQHNAGQRGAKYTRSRRPVRLVYQEQQQDHSAALKREMEIKRLQPQAKRALAKRR
ncbi:COG2827: putative endonuclease containing a URI domain [hydrothermal vent metagenome]|uniref:COG2827: putative endonuclease containing a URI domain n=1 Tax=hydrothermal vent metagenome TaxID=652676 RepID=A0A3B1B0U6_9ZZZZ